MVSSSMTGMDIRELQLARPLASNTPCPHTPLKGAHCYGCPTKPKTANQRKLAQRARAAQK